MTYCNGVILASNSKVVAVIHARMSSSRFPGKMLALLGEMPVLEWVVRRTMCAEGVHRFVLATSDLRADDVLATLGEQLGIEVFRGSHEDVLRRVIDAAELHHADAVLRVCADNPLIDPRLLTQLIEDFRVLSCDYLFNHRPGLGLIVADGFGGEVFDLAALKSVPRRFSETRYHEHLTSAFWEHQDVFMVRSCPVDKSLQYPELRFDVDVPADLQYLNDLVSRGRINLNTSATEIVSVALGA